MIIDRRCEHTIFRLLKSNSKIDSQELFRKGEERSGSENPNTHTTSGEHGGGDCGKE